MAKYCFYCGRELHQAEKCQCRNSSGATAREAAAGVGSADYNAKSTAGQRASSGASGASGATGAFTGTASGTSSGSAAGPFSRASSGSGRTKATNSSSAKTGFRKNFSEKFRQFSRGFTTPSQSARPMRSSRLQTLRDQIRILFPTFSIVWRNISGFFLRPATKIRQESMRPKLRWSIPIILIVSVLSGFLGMLFSRAGSPLFDSVMNLVLGENISLLYIQPVYSMIGFSLLALLFILVMCLSFFIASILSRKKLRFRKVIDLVSISLIYLLIPEIILLITMSLGSRGALSLLFISFESMSICHLISFRTAMSLTEDTIFLFLLFVYSSCYLIFRTVLDATALFSRIL